MKNPLTKIMKRLQYATILKIRKFKVKRAQDALAKLDDRDQSIIKIVKAALMDRRNRLMIAPISGARYIRMPDEEMFIIITENRVIISNHKFYYDLHTPTVLSNYLIQKFNQIANHQRDLMERDMTRNIESGLFNIAEKLEKKIKDDEIKLREQLSKEPKDSVLEEH